MPRTRSTVHWQVCSRTTTISDSQRLTSTSGYCVAMPGHRDSDNPQSTGIRCQCPGQRQQPRNLRRSKADLRSDFYNIITFLTLTTAINNRGLPTLRQNYVEGYYLDNTSLSMAPVLPTINAVAQILLRNYRAVTVAVPNSSWHQPTPSALNTGAGFQVYAIQDEELQSENINFKDHGITVLPPITNTGDSQRLQTSGHAIITKGASHFGLISNTNWECLTIP